MGWSKETRIKTMLGIDLVFLICELVVGILAHSLALQADAFHMLNDIISLAIGLWAVTVASNPTNDKYSYGFLRAEIIGAFFNAVFLIALCVSIILEAITRFIDPPKIQQAWLILIVGCLGLTSNIAGFFVLGGHGHSHGPGGHDHGHEHTEEDQSHKLGDQVRAAEEGRADLAGDGTLAVTLTRDTTETSDASRRIRFGNGQDDGASRGGPNGGSRRDSRARSISRRSRRGSLRHNRITSIDDINIYPASFRQDIIAASRPQTDGASDSDSDDESSDKASAGPTAADGHHADEESPLLAAGERARYGGNATSAPMATRDHAPNGVHEDHHHNKPKKAGKKGHGHGHSHGDMGMDAMILHVIGDALGNIGVITTALVVWLTNFWWKDYTDPAVSLFITLIILKQALPLTSATAKILLQATPDNIDAAEIRQDIEALEGVNGCHHMHIWQLSDKNLVASLHMRVAFSISEEGGRRYMQLARRARECLHEHGIHSATIQPEFCLDEAEAGLLEDDSALRLDGGASAVAGSVGSAGSVANNACLLKCVDNCVGKGCCASVVGTASPGVSSRRGSDSSH